MRCVMLWQAACAVLLAWLCGCSADSEPERQLPPAGVVTTPIVDASTKPIATDNPRDATFANPTAGDGGVVVTPDAGPCAAQACPVDSAVPDNDGFTIAEGDCDDFNPLINPGAYDVPNNGIDEDCQGGDATTDSCDDMLDIGSKDPLAAARAIELCPVSDVSSRNWGVISARWTTPDGAGTPGSDLMHGLLPNLGSNFMPRAGKTMLALSSGVARAPGQVDYTDSCSDEFPTDSAKFPADFDGMSSSCPASAEATEIVDAVALEVQVRVPSNVSAMSFDSAFFTEEYPDFICTPFNDFFQTIVKPLRMGASADGNVVFDLDGNAVSVNNSLLRACTPGDHGGKTFSCPLGYDLLKGTGYDNCNGGALSPGGGLFGGGLFGGSNTGTMSSMDPYGASTGWLNTEFAVKAGEIITLRFMIWDSGDSELDSLALIDHVHFRLLDNPPPANKPMTQPIVPQ
jgi:hypothetical protein